MSGNMHGELFAFAAVADAQHHVGGGDHAQVAMAGLGRVHKHGGRAGGRQRGGDLAADVAALAHAHHHHATLAVQHQLGGLGKRIAQRSAMAVTARASMVRVSMASAWARRGSKGWGTHRRLSLAQGSAADLLPAWHAGSHRGR
jgi:hypothetical protein